jgi:hypothetical protein
MRFKPERASSPKWIYPSVLPPRTFTAAPMDLTVMGAADRHGEFVADLAAKCTSLREAEMMRIRRPPTANQARLFHHVSDVVTVTEPPRFREHRHTLIDP